MRKKKLESTLQLQRIAAIPHNPNLQKDIKSIRIKYGLNKLSEDQARGWYAEQVNRAHTRSTINYLISRPNGEARTSMEHPLDTDISFEKDVGVLLSRYRLPMSQFLIIGLYATIGYPHNIESLKAWKPGIGRVLRLQEELGRFEISIVNLNSSTTKGDWNKIWDTEVLPLVEELREIQGITPLAKKAMLLSMHKQMERWSEWYQLSEIQGLGPTKALEEWEKTHQNEAGNFDLSTVTHAIQDFKEIITPIPIED